MALLIIKHHPKKMVENSKNNLKKHPKLLKNSKKHLEEMMEI
jgi:hypothetical protein